MKNPLEQLTKEHWSFGDSREFLPHEVIENPENWKKTIRFLEAEGFSVSAVTKKFPDGIFCAEISEDQKTLGWGIEGEDIEKIRVVYVGFPIISEKPQAPKTAEPGLKFVPTIGMGLTYGEQKNPDFYHAPIFLPSSRIGFQQVNTTGIQYGQGAFEGGCATYTKTDTNEWFSIFRISDLADRFQKSCEALHLPPFPRDFFLEMIQKVVQINKKYIPKNNGKLYIRPSVCGGEGGLGIIPPENVFVTFEVAAFGDYYPEGIEIEGRLDIQRPRTGADKIAPNYGGSFRVKKGVKERGYQDYLSFDEKGNAEEVATCSIGFVRQCGDDFEYVFPIVRGEESDKKKSESRHSLPSITRKTTIEILQVLGEKVTIRDVHHTEIPQLDGAFTMGNAVGILKIGKIDIREDEDEPILVSIEFKNPEALGAIDHLRDQVYHARQGILENEKLRKFNDQWVVKI